LTLDGIAYVVNEECIDIGAAYTATQSGTEFRWMSYNLDTQQWKTISDWNGGKTGQTGIQSREIIGFM